MGLQIPKSPRLSAVLILTILLGTGLAASRAESQQVNSDLQSAASPFSIELRPGFDLPIGQSASYFKFGGTMDVNLRYRLSTLPVFLLGGVAYALAPAVSPDSISIFTAAAGAGAQLRISRTFALEAFGLGGYFYGTLNDFSVGSSNPYAAGGLGVRFALNPYWSLGVSGLYRSYFGLYQGISVAASTGIALGSHGSTVVARSSGSSGGESGDSGGSETLSPFSIEVRPGFDIPVGQTASYFKFGGTMDVNLRYRLSSLPVFFLGGLTYAFAPAVSPDSVSIATASIGAGAQLQLSRSLALEAFALGGYFYGTLNDFSVGSSNPYAAGGAGVRFALSPSWSIGLSGLYRSYFGLYQGVSAAVSTSFTLGGGQTRSASRAGTVAPSPSKATPQPLSAPANAAPGENGGLRIEKTDVVPVFPVFYSYYDDHPIGTVEVSNGAPGPVSNVTASVFIKQFMDNPKQVKVDGNISPGETKSIDLYALFTDNVLSITEGTKASAQITLDYTSGGTRYEETKIETVSFLNRNAMTWDDNRRAAAFVTAKDPAILTFSKSIIGLVRSKEVRSINTGLQTAMALHESLDLFGMNYVPDPTTPYVEFSKQKDAVDFLQFPRQTLQYKAGDCDDLSILYSSLLESVGLNAAFVTTPGHIFVAVDTGLSPKQAVDSLIPADQIIVNGGHAWIPVEITLRHQGFLKAWELGAKEWNSANPVGRAGFYPIEDAWNSYSPVGLPGQGANIIMPPSDKVLATYLAEVTKYIDQAIFPQVARLQSEIRSSGSLRAMNQLGIVYAKYGQPDKAKLQFNQILAKNGNYLPAVLNLGNLAYLDQDWLSAQKYYQQASQLAPENTHVLLAVARVNRELENYGNVKRSYEKLKALDPALAEQYSYLALGPQAGSARAADVQTELKEVVWEGE